MSRSWKKNKWSKVGDPSFKKIFNRKIRRNSKYMDLPSGNAYRKVNDSWDICDYRFRHEKKDLENWNLYDTDEELERQYRRLNSK